MSRAYVKQCAIGPDSKIRGSYDDDPFRNSIIYEVEFNDGTIKEYSANVITDNMVQQVDSEGFILTLMEGIADYKKDSDTAINKHVKYIVTRRSQRKLQKTTSGWKLLV